MNLARALELLDRASSSDSGKTKSGKKPKIVEKPKSEEVVGENIDTLWWSHVDITEKHIYEDRLFWQVGVDKPERIRNHISYSVVSLLHGKHALGATGIATYRTYAGEIEPQQDQTPPKTKRDTNFDWLQHRLCEIFPELIVPSLPSKSLGADRFSPEFVNKRRRGLHRWLAYVASHPLLGSTMELRCFLGYENTLGKAEVHFARKEPGRGRGLRKAGQQRPCGRNRR